MRDTRSEKEKRRVLRRLRKLEAFADKMDDFMRPYNQKRRR